MPRKKKNGTAYSGGHIRVTRHGTFRAELYIHGKQKRPTFKTRAEAEGWLATNALLAAQQSRPLSALEMADAREAFSLLPPGVTLAEAARAWNAERGRALKPTLMADALEQILQEKSSLERRQRTQTGYREHVGKFVKDAGGQATLHVHEVTAEMIKGWLQDCGYRGNTWNGYRRTLRAFFAWAQSEGMIHTNPVEDVPKATARRQTPECMPVTRVAAFLRHTAEMDPELVPYFVVGFFTGTRTAELDRFDLSCWQEDCIRIGPGQAKTGQQRYITIQPNLRAWLEVYPLRPDGRLRLANHRRRYRAIIHALEKEDPGFHWPRNAMRHSFASYHLAKFRNAATTAHELGHQSPALLFNTYRTLAKEEDGLAYFEIRP